MSPTPAMVKMWSMSQVTRKEEMVMIYQQLIVSDQQLNGSDLPTIDEVSDNEGVSVQSTPKKTVDAETSLDSCIV
jgi:hypothetical protein